MSTVKILYFDYNINNTTSQFIIFQKRRNPLFSLFDKKI